MSTRHETVYTPDSVLSDPRRMFRDMFRDLAASRELAWRLAVRDLRAQYRQAFLGFVWAFILPAANSLAWLLLSASDVVSIAPTPLPYVAYVASGATVWSVLMDAVNAPLQQTNAARSMLAKLSFPREAIVISGLLQTLFNAGIKSVVLLVVLLGVGVYPGWSALLFPFALLSLALVGTTIGMLITPIGVLYTDVGRALPLLTQFLMFVTPVVVPMPERGWVATVFALNPLSPLILTARDLITGVVPAHVAYFLAVNAVAVLVLLAVWILYRLAMPILIERMSA
jgi:lipopolysaccharide transport system permease protein